MKEPPFSELVRHFFSGLLRPETVAGEDSFLNWIVQILAILIAASWIFPTQLLHGYLELHRLDSPHEYLLSFSSDCLMAVVLLTLLVALITVLEWSSLFLSRRDYLVLMPLPITRTRMFAAKLASLLIFITLFIVAIVLMSAIALPAVSSGRWESRALPVRVFALFIGEVSGCYFAFFALLGIQGTLLLLPLRWFARLSFLIQSILLIALLCAFPLLPYLPRRSFIENHSAWMNVLPPCWFWGWTQQLMGDGSPRVAALARRAEIGLLCASFLAAVGYLISYVRSMRFASESPRASRMPRLDLPAWFIRGFRQPAAQATGEFILRTLARGQQQKPALLLIAGIGIAISAEDYAYVALSPPRMIRGNFVEEAVIALPLTLSFFLMVGLRRAFRIPAELQANWIFRLCEVPALRRNQLNAVYFVFILLGATPALVLCAPLQFAILGRAAPGAILLEAILAASLAAHLMTGWKAVPFTSAANPARRHVLHSVSIHLGELFIYAFVLPSLIPSQMRRPESFAILLIAFLGLAAVLDWRRRREWAQNPLEFEEQPPREVSPLQLSA